jgi:hypothetical protein
MRRVGKMLLVVIGLLVGLLAGPAWMVVSGAVDIKRSWRNSDRSSAGIAPAPTEFSPAVVQVYGARTVAWRGAFGIHTWIAVKPAGAAAYTRHEVVGWRARSGLPVVMATQVRQPDLRWFGATPDLLFDVRGPAAEALIPAIDSAVASYPWPDRYTIWPGPNSNSFVAWVARHSPGLAVDLPPTAIGKDYLGGATVFGPAPSGSGYQISLAGLLGVTLARDEGFEISILGLGVGIDPFAPALRLPGIGRLGPKQGAKLL